MYEYMGMLMCTDMDMHISSANLARQRLSLVHGTCCVEEDKTVDPATGLPALTAADKPTCRETPSTKLPQVQQRLIVCR